MAESEKPKSSNCPTCPVLGKRLLENDLQRINYPKIKSPNKSVQHSSKQKTLSKEEKKAQYYLGNGFFTNDPDEAMDEYLRRECSEVPKYQQKPHPPIFSPECYSYGSTAKNVMIQKEGREGLEGAKKEKLNKHDGDLLGKIVEEELHNKLRNVLEKLKITNTVMISGWQVMGGKNVTSREFDFFIVSEKLKTFIHIESKRTLTSNSRTSALNQLKNGFDLLNSSIPFPRGNGWHYVKAIYFQQDVPSDMNSYCNECKEFLLDKDKDLLDWLKNFLPNTDDLTRHNSSPYVDIIKYLFHQKYQQGEAITESDYLNESKELTESVSTMNNIFFWSDVQFNVLQDVPKNKRMVFVSPFGTGKTTLLKEKAQRLLKEKRNVIVIVFHDPEIYGNSILFNLYQQHFKSRKFDEKKVNIVQMSSTGKCIAEKVKKMIADNPESSFFMDEVFVREDGISINDLNDFSTMLSKESFLWIACQSEHPIPEEYLEGFTVPKMNQLLRYSSNVLKVTKKIRENEGDTCFPPMNVNPDAYLNRGQRAIFFALKRDANLACAVDQLSNVLEKSKAKTLIKIDFERELIVSELKKSSIKDRLVFAVESESLEKFLDPSNTATILVVSSRDNSLIRGIEVPVVVHFTSVIGGDQVQAIYSRCQSKLIIICKEEHATKVVPSNAQSEAAKLIHVYANLMPTTYETHLMAKDYVQVISFLKDPRRAIPVDSRNKASETSLMIACKIGAFDIFETLFDLGANLDAVDSLGWNPVHHAAAGGHLKSIEKVIQKSKDQQRALSMKILKPNFSDFFKISLPLLLATAFDFKFGFLFLIIASQFFQVLYKSYKTNSYKKVVILDATTNEGEKAIHLSAAVGHHQIVNFLLETKTCSHVDEFTDVSPCSTALHLATINGHLETVKCLIKWRANPDLTQETSDTTISDFLRIFKSEHRVTTSKPI